MATKKPLRPYHRPPTRPALSAWLTLALAPMALFATTPRGIPEATHPAFAAINLSERTSAFPAYPGMIAKSDVAIRGLLPRSTSAEEPHDTLEAIQRFHATRLEWTYHLTPEFVAKVKAMGVTVSGVTSTATNSFKQPEAEIAKTFGVLDLNLNPVTAPWMRTWSTPGLWLCINHPAGRESSLDQIKQQYDLGLRDFQRDDPKANEAAFNWGACFCSHCMARFRTHLQAHCPPEELRLMEVTDIAGFDYRLHLLARNAPVGDAFNAYQGGKLKEHFLTFQRESSIEFHRWWRAELNRYAGHYVPASSNNGGRNFTGVYDPFDFWIGELPAERVVPRFFFDLAQTLRKLGKGQTLTMPLAPGMTSTAEWIRVIRVAIAAAYSNGLHIEAPWDTYLPTLHHSRFFGDAKDYADLFAMVRASASLLDGYEDVAATGMNLVDTRWREDNQPVSLFAGNAPVTTFVRAKPNAPDAPVVVHLMNWGESAQPFHLSLRPEVIFSGRPFRAVLYTPVAYDEQAHDQAFDAKNYERLIQRTVLTEEPVASLPIPSLRPWAILSLEPLPPQAHSTKPWSPHAWWDEQGRLQLGSATPGARVHFTLNGEAPDHRAAQFSAPFTVSAHHSLRAIAIMGNKSSSETTLTLSRANSSHELLQNPLFEVQLQNWELRTRPPGAEASSIETSFIPSPSPERGSAIALKLTRKTSSAAWHLRLAQPVKIPLGSLLSLQTTLESDRPATVRVGLVQSGPPNRPLTLQVIDLTPGVPFDVRMHGHSEADKTDCDFVVDFGLMPEEATLSISKPSVSTWKP